MATDVTITDEMTGEIFPSKMPVWDGKGKLTDWLGKQMGVSGRSIREVKRIVELHPELEPYIWNGTCTIQDAKILCTLDEWAYSLMFIILHDGKHDVFKANIKALRQEAKQEQQEQAERCPHCGQPLPNKGVAR